MIPLPHIVFAAQVGLASVFGYPGDRWAGGSLRCHRHLSSAAFKRAKAEGCAHRTLPCGARLLVQDLRTGRQATCAVIDRGPYGAMHRGRWVLKRRTSDPGRWRGVADLLPPVARRLGLNGLDLVLLRVLSTNRSPP